MLSLFGHIDTDGGAELRRSRHVTGEGHNGDNGLASATGLLGNSDISN
jgi:hypothetical protein